jgi:protein TonB
MVLVAGMVVAPMVWPEAMPPAVFTLLAPMAPPGRAAKPNPEPKPRVQAAPIRKPYIPKPGLVQPTYVPPAIQAETEPPDTVVGNVAGPGSWVDGGIGGGGGGLVDDVIRASQNVGPKEPPVKADPVKPDPVPIRRVTQGGMVEAPRLVYRVEPRYPQLALMSHVEGVVNLKGVIAIDGHISELAIESGHPLLVKAAVEAVRQWRYSATRLNGVPVEVVTTIAVTFTLNR